MINKETSAGLVRGFVLTLLLLLAMVLLFQTAVGQTPGEEGNLPQAQATVEEAAPGRTDDPQGRVLIPLEEENLPDSNLDLNAISNSDTLVFTPEEASVIEQGLVDSYSSPLVIPAADFSDDGANPDSHFFPFSGGYHQGDAENYGCMVAPVYLPNGVTVDELFVTVYDDDTTFDLYADIRRVDNFAGGTDTLASVNTTGEFAGIQVISDPTINYPVVLYPDYSYYATLCLLSGSMRTYSVRLYYSQ